MNPIQGRESAPDRPNVIFVFGDQWRAQATGYAGDPNVRTPHLNAFAERSLRFTRAVANCPVCAPSRATLMTGQYPLTHGVFVNDVPLGAHAKSLGECFREAGYDTAYIGKWHLDGHGRSAFIPPERRMGFDYWKARECTHDYNRSFYYSDSPEKLWWEEYDAIAQTRDAQAYIRSRPKDRPFFLMLSWGPPHDPYDTAPEEFRSLYDPERIQLRPNVPAEITDAAREWLAGYYAHCSALDRCFGELLQTIRETGIEGDTLLVFTSDHGDMLGSHGCRNKQRPYDESILVPLLLRYPAVLGEAGRDLHVPINTPDFMPTLLGLAGLEIPDSVEGSNFAPYLRGEGDPPKTAALIELPVCFHQYAYHNGGRDWRGLRTERYTYVIDHDGPWILFDNERDPYQLHNRVNDPEYASLRAELHRDLWERLKGRGDAFRRGQEYLGEAGYRVDERGDPVYQP
ncbi:MAG: sulfatase [Armatimonadetes bacterium]|nr:sulfatase [Armatimonadota bacterium]